MQRVLNDGEINIQIINSCNLNCVWCGRKWYGGTPEYRYMNTQKFKRIVDRCLDCGITDFCLTPMMGEVFLDRDFYDKVWYLERNHRVRHFFFATNLLNAQTGRLKGLTKMRLEVSVYGYDSKSYLKNTGYDGFDEFVNRLISLVKDKTFPITLYIRFPESLCKKFDVLLKFFETKGVEISYDETHNYNWGGLIPEGSLQAEHPMIEKVGVCPTAHTGCIFEDGQFGLCYMNDIERTMLFGNIFDKSLYGLKNNDKYKKVIENMTNNVYEGICERCNEKW